jgi:general secretion pathway protein N
LPLPNRIVAAAATTLLCVVAVQAKDLPAPQNPLLLRSFDQLTATRERPLFSPTRRPPPPPVLVDQGRPAPPPDPPNLALLGIVKDLSGGSAIIRSKSSDKVLRVRVGDKVDSWKVGQVEERKLVLSLDGRSTVFTLFNGGQPTDDSAVVAHRPPPILEVNAAGILTAHRVRKAHR